MNKQQQKLPSPYKGLVPYTEEDYEFFFGRNEEIEIIEANILASQLTLLYGASGVGKSSVLRAGVLHHLQETTAKNLRDYGNPEYVAVVFNSWRDDPTKNLVRTIYAEIVKAIPNKSFQPSDMESPLADAIRTWTEELNSDLLIILDQFEEYFLYYPEEEGCNFDVEFPRAVNDQGLRVNFLIAIREDALAKLDRFKGRIPKLFENYLRLEYLDLESGQNAIIKPIEQFNKKYSPTIPIKIEDALTDAVLSQVATGKLMVGEMGRGGAAQGSKGQIETPYLQLVMNQLWEVERGKNSPVLTVNTLNRLGGAQKIVSNHLDNVMKKFRLQDRTTASVFFQYLVTPSGSKIAYPVHDLIGLSKRSPKDVENILQQLEKERLLRHIPFSTGQSKDDRYEIYHDVLGRSILDWRSRFLRFQKLVRAGLDGLVFIAPFIAFFIAIIYNNTSTGTILLCSTPPIWLLYFIARKRFKIFAGM